MNAAASKIKAWRANPVLMVNDLFLSIELDGWQKDMLEAFPRREPKYQRMAAQACVGPGKTFVDVMIAINFMLTYGGPNGDTTEHPECAVTSITGDNLRDGFWKELNVWYDQSPLLQSQFEITAERMFHRQHPKTWFTAARTFARRADKQSIGRTLSGLHSKNLLYILDESGQMPLEILMAAEQGLSNCQFGKIIQTGNPMSLEGPLYFASVLHPDLWFVVKVNNDPEDPKRSKRANLAWAVMMIKLWGRDNPWVQYAVLGQFPPSAFNTLIGPEAVEEAMEREIPVSSYNFMQKRRGVDVAFQGDDMTVIADRQGLKYFQTMPIRLDLTRRDFCAQIGGRILNDQRIFEAEITFIDGTGGYGQGVYENVTQHKYIQAESVLFNAKALNPRFYNKRTEMWWNFIDHVKNGGSLPRSESLIAGLSTATYTLKNGLFLMEPKEIMKVRLGRSPDEEDAMALTHAQPDCRATSYQKELEEERPAKKRSTGYSNPAR